MSLRLLTILVALSSIAIGVFIYLIAPRERRIKSSDGRIIINEEFLTNGSTHPRLFQFAEVALGLLPSSFHALDKASLKQAAQSRCGPGELWHHPYAEEALTQFTNAIEIDKPPLTYVGRMMLRENFVSWLCVQIELNKLLEKHPEILHEPLDAVVIAGSPRTGSTHLMSMLCKHPNATCLTFAEAISPLSPVSRGDQVLTWRDIRYWRSFGAAGLILTLRPLFASMFKFGPTVPMEELQLGAVVFGSSIFCTQIPLPSYDDWFRRTDHTPMEQYVRLLLQVIQYQRKQHTGITGNKLWILKSPQNADQLGPKTRVFPAANVVFTHREAVPVMQSLIGMVGYTVGIFNHPEKVNYRQLARLWLEHQRWSLVDKLSKSEVDKFVPSKERLMNVRFQDFMADPVGMGLKVARHAGLADDTAARDAFEQFQRESPQEGSKVFKYDTSSFGIEEEEIRRLFAPYEREYL